MTQTADNDTHIIDQLAAAAKAASENAYRPYSNFAVGAALVSKGGRIFTGVNVENRSFGLTCCAERSALFAMVGAGEKEFEHMVIYTPTKTATAPCGACREVMAEFSPDAQASFTAVCDSPEEVLSSTVGKLLPFQFRL